MALSLSIRMRCVPKPPVTTSGGDGRRLAIVASHPIQYQAPLFRSLAERVDLTVFFAHRATSADQAAAGFGVAFDWDVDLLSGYKHVFLRNIAAQPSLEHFSGCDTPEIGARLREGCFDAVLVTGWHLKTFVQALAAAKRMGLPTLVRGDSQLETPRSFWKRGMKAATYPMFLRLFDAALYVGERSRAYWLHYGYPPRRMHFSPHCVDNDWFAARATREARAALRGRLNIDEAAKVVLFAGKLVPFKRPLDVVAAAGRLRHKGQNVIVLVAGSGPLADELTRAAAAAGVSLHHLGFCNQSAMPAAYAASDVLVLPSDGGETWGLVANEALACGRPIILSGAVGSAPDLAGDGRVGRVFPTGNIDALAVALGDILRDPPSRASIAAKSEAYSIGAAVDGIMMAITDVNGGRRVAAL